MLIIVLIVWLFGFVVDILGLFIGLVLFVVFGVGLGFLLYFFVFVIKDCEWLFWGV